MENKIIEIDTEYIKLDSLLKLSGETCTGGQAKKLILSGNVSVNGNICLKRGSKIRDNDKVKCGQNTYQVCVR